MVPRARLPQPQGIVTIKRKVVMPEVLRVLRQEHGQLGRLLDALDEREYFSVRESQDSIPATPQPLISDLVVRLLLNVLTTVDLNHKVLLQADKIDDVLTHRMLPAKLVSREAAQTQRTPEGAFGIGRV